MEWYAEPITDLIDHNIEFLVERNPVSTLGPEMGVSYRKTITLSLLDVAGNFLPIAHIIDASPQLTGSPCWGNPFCFKGQQSSESTDKVVCLDCGYSHHKSCLGSTSMNTSVGCGCKMVGQIVSEYVIIFLHDEH